MVAVVNDWLWVGNCLGSDRGADGGFSPFVKNSCRSATDRISLCQPGR
jgi:hypothetical protein